MELPEAVRHTFPFSLLNQGLVNLQRNASSIYYDLTLVHWIRIATIISGYLLLRPYLVRWSGGKQAADLDQMTGRKAEGPVGGAKATTAKKSATTMEKTGKRDEVGQGRASSSTAVGASKRDLRMRPSRPRDADGNVTTILDVEEKHLLDDDVSERKRMEDLLVDYEEEDWNAENRKTE